MCFFICPCDGQATGSLTLEGHLWTAFSPEGGAGLPNTSLVSPVLHHHGTSPPCLAYRNTTASFLKAPRACQLQYGELPWMEPRRQEPKAQPAGNRSSSIWLIITNQVLSTTRGGLWRKPAHTLAYSPPQIHLAATQRHWDGFETEALSWPPLTPYTTNTIKQ